jgi:lactate dehydrogenase-like 2-hydroxyacid dehydrogenase
VAKNGGIEVANDNLKADNIYSFHPGYLTADRLKKCKNLKIAVTAGIGSDHVDLNEANKTNGGITVAEVTGSNVVRARRHDHPHSRPQLRSRSRADRPW